MHSVGWNAFVTYVRDDDNDLKAILWRYDDDKLTRLASAGSEGEPVVSIAGCAPERETGLAAVEGVDGNLKLFAYGFPEGIECVQRRGSAQA